MTGAPEDTLALGGITASALHARAELTIAGLRYEAPVTFSDRGRLRSIFLLGHEGFLRFFRVTICAKELWLDVEPEARA